MPEPFDDRVVNTLDEAVGPILLVIHLWGQLFANLAATQIGQPYALQPFAIAVP